MNITKLDYFKMKLHMRFMFNKILPYWRKAGGGNEHAFDLQWLILSMEY